MVTSSKKERGEKNSSIKDYYHNNLRVVSGNEPCNVWTDGMITTVQPKRGDGIISTKSQWINYCENVWVSLGSITLQCTARTPGYEPVPKPLT